MSKKPSRKDPTLTEKLAATLLMLHEIPREHAKMMTAEQILSLFEWDHEVHFAVARDLGWPPEKYNHPTNLTPRLILEHAEKTNKIDKPAIAKSKRIAKAAAEHSERMAQIATELAEEILNPPKTKRGIPSRPFQKGHRPIPSRPFSNRRKASP